VIVRYVYFLRKSGPRREERRRRRRRRRTRMVIPIKRAKYASLKGLFN
jgi:hypothetical protein